MKRNVWLVAILPLMLAGCSGSGPVVTPEPLSTVSASPGQPSPTPTPAEPSDVYLDTQDSQGDGDFAGALSDVGTSSCAADGGTWVGAGTVTNPTDQKADYRVWVAFIDADSQTVGLVQSNVDGVKAGASGDFSASMPYTDSGALTCVLRVERRVAG